jgi:hypothetical protein
VIAKGFIMLKNDKKVATFNSAFKNGNVELWCCVHRDVYELRYDVQFYTPDGLTDATALSSYDAGDYIQVGAILTDAIELANTPLLERD